MFDLTSFTAIFTAGMLTEVFIFACFFNKKLITLENKYIIAPLSRLWHRICRFIRNRLKSNERFMKWLNKPQKHGKPDAEWIEGQIKVFGDVWRM